jgi:hypothetical protein
MNFSYAYAVKSLRYLENRERLVIKSVYYVIEYTICSFLTFSICDLSNTCGPLVRFSVSSRKSMSFFFPALSFLCGF